MSDSTPEETLTDVQKIWAAKDTAIRARTMWLYHEKIASRYTADSPTFHHALTEAAKYWLQFVATALTLERVKEGEEFQPALDAVYDRWRGNWYGAAQMLTGISRIGKNGKVDLDLVDKQDEVLRNVQL